MSINLVIAQLDAGNFELAQHTCEKLISHRATEQLYLLSAEIYFRSGNLTRAIERLQQGCSIVGDTAALHLRKAQLLLHNRCRKEAIVSSEKALTLAKNDPIILHSIGQLFMQCDSPNLAKIPLGNAKGLLPENQDILYDFALCHHFISSTDQAKEALESLIKLNPEHGPALHLRSSLAKVTPKENHIHQLEVVLSSQKANEYSLVHAGFALAKELEDLGEYAKSFSALEKASELKRRRLQYNVDNDVRDMVDLNSCFKKDVLARINEGTQEKGAIFIVGLPRSGTTLVERILCQDPDLCSVGEITDFPTILGTMTNENYRTGNFSSPLEAAVALDYNALGKRYMQSAKQLANKSFFIDKLPFNFRYIGLIKKALPNSKIIHLVRNPIDVGYAMYKTLFHNVYSFSYRLEETAKFIAEYKRLMQHWRLVMPDSFLDIHYEDLVKNPVTESKRLYNWTGFNWHEDVLKFYQSAGASSTASSAQIRQPIYRSSVSKWKNLEFELQPLISQLMKEGIIDEDGNELSLEHQS